MKGFIDIALNHNPKPRCSCKYIFFHILLIISLSRNIEKNNNNEDKGTFTGYVYRQIKFSNRNWLLYTQGLAVISSSNLTTYIWEIKSV